ncbi:hypothetical protein SAMN05444277_1301 [Parafilimonas terrae]|uniref:Uncharacterized protein n=1 Tax=Parafilimonas terrae TaxID=1465490 RepID=A0A1I5ZHM5_9BACT|nr:hypothetical protein SAMN05444277_1301 [Parafilimonas terrae]
MENKNKKENSNSQDDDYVITPEYLSTCIRGTFKHVGNKCKFVQDENGCFYLNPLTGKMCYVTDSGVV